MFAPFGIGALYAREDLLLKMRPFLYGGDMIAEGRVTPEKVEYNQLPSTKDIPVYILTNYGGEEMESELTKNLNAEKYMIKADWTPSKIMPFLKEKLGLK